MYSESLILVLFITVAVKRYFESQVRASKGTSPEEGKKKRIVSRRTKVSDLTYVKELKVNRTVSTAL